MKSRLFHRRRSPDMLGLDLARRISGFPVISCDVFDTAIARALARPEDVLLAIGARARAQELVSCGPDEFREYRLQAEREARKDAERSGYDEPQLSEVYACFMKWGVASATATPEQLLSIELATERSVSRAVEAVREVLTARDPNQRLIFLSDTILPSSFLADLLSSVGYGDRCTVITSSDTRRSKHSGRLFAHLKEVLGYRASDLVHIGDNPISDVARAREHGIATVHVPPPARASKSPEGEDVHFVARLAHSRRWKASNISDHEPISLRATKVGGLDHLHRYVSLLLIGFTLFVLDEARRRGINRIYFLARDGYLPLAIAERLVKRRGQSLDLRYLHVSRRSIVVPTMVADLSRLAEDIARSMSGQPLQTTFEFLGIDAATAASMLGAIGLDPNQPASGSFGLEAIHRFFAKYKDQVLERLHERRRSALAYLQQSGFLTPGPRLVVDVGWRGTTQTALAELTGIPKSDIAGCYLGLLPEALRDGFTPQTAAGYLFSFGYPRTAMEMVLDGYVLLELFFSAPHGTVRHYAQEGERAVPVFATEAELDASVRREAFARIEEGCLKEFESIDAILDGAWPESIDAKSATADMERLLTRPSKAEVTAVNKIPFIHGVNDGRCAVAVNPWPLRELLLNPKALVRRVQNAAWRSGSIRASLPWPIPDMTYLEFRHRVDQLERLTLRGRFS